MSIIGPGKIQHNTEIPWKTMLEQGTYKSYSNFLVQYPKLLVLPLPYSLLICYAVLYLHKYKLSKYFFHFFPTIFKKELFKRNRTVRWLLISCHILYLCIALLSNTYLYHIWLENVSVQNVNKMIYEPVFCRQV